MAISLIQEKTGTHLYGNNRPIVLSSIPGDGNLLVAYLYSALEEPDSISGGGVTWKKAVSILYPGVGIIGLWYGYNASGEGSKTITFSFPESQTTIIDILEFSGVESSKDPFLSSNSDAENNSGPVTAGSLITNLTDLVVSFGSASGGQITAASNNFTLLSQIDTFGNRGAYNTAGSSSTTFTYTGSLSSGWAALIANFASQQRTQRTHGTILGEFEGESLDGGSGANGAFNNPGKLDLIQVRAKGGGIVWNADWSGNSSNNPANPTLKTIFGRYDGQTFAQAFPNPEKFDILQVVNSKGQVIYFIDYQGNGLFVVN